MAIVEVNISMSVDGFVTPGLHSAAHQRLRSVFGQVPGALRGVP